MPNITIPDISEFQGDVNWAVFPHEAVIVRLNYGASKVDAKADRNINGARSRCKAIGWYTYLVANVDPVAQADVLCRVIQAHGGLKPNEFIVCDDEEGSGDQSGRIDTYLNECDKQLKTPHPSGEDWWYSGLSFSLVHNLAHSRGHRWIAAYGQGEPLVSHDIWQFTDASTVAGIGGAVDMSVFHGNINSLIALIGGGIMSVDPAEITAIHTSVDDQWGMQVWGTGPKTGQVSYAKTALDAIIAHLGQDDATLAAIGVKLDAVFTGLGDIRAVLGSAPPSTSKEQAILDIVTRMESGFKQV